MVRRAARRLAVSRRVAWGAQGGRGGPGATPPRSSETRQPPSAIFPLPVWRPLSCPVGPAERERIRARLRPGPDLAVPEALGATASRSTVVHLTPQMSLRPAELELGAEPASEDSQPHWRAVPVALVERAQR